MRKHELGFSIQKIDRRNIQRTSERIQSRKNYFIGKLNTMRKEHIVCVDETHLAFSTTQRKYGCFNRQERPVLENEVVRQKKFALFCAITAADIPHYEIHDITQQSTTSSHIISFLHNLNNKLPSHYSILLDNAPIHRSEERSSIIESMPRQFIFLPPYHPELNPIEFVFSEFKRALYGTDIINLPQNLRSLISRYNATQYHKLCNYYHHSFVTNTKQSSEGRTQINQ